MHRLTQREKRINERKNPPEEHPEFQIAPMVDILLVLLVFFMTISTTQVLQSNRKIHLAVAADGKIAGKNPGQVVVNIIWTAGENLGSVEVNETSYPDPGSIRPILEKTLEANPLIRVLVRADKAVNWEYERSVLKVIAESGVSNVTFSVVDKEGSK